MKAVLRRLAKVLGSLALLAVLVFGVFPTRTYLAQRDATNRASERLEVLRTETDQLEDRAAALDSDAEIERLAREDQGLVMPGEEPYVVLRAPLPPVDLPELWLVGDPDGTPVTDPLLEVEAVPAEPTQG